MKKIISILLVILFLSSNLSFADCMSDCKGPIDTTFATCMNNAHNDEVVIQACNSKLADDSVVCENQCGTSMLAQTESDCNKGNYGGRNPDTKRCCSKGQTYNSTTKTCDNSTTTTTPTSSACSTVNGITICPDCLLNGQCKLNIYETLGIRKSITNPGDATSVGLFVQDIVLSATFFIGTIVTVALVISGLMYIFAGASGKDPTKAKNGMINSLIGLAIVACSYFIVRLVQYLAKGF